MRFAGEIKKTFHTTERCTSAVCLKCILMRTTNKSRVQKSACLRQTRAKRNRVEICLPPRSFSYVTQQVLSSI